MPLTPLPLGLKGAAYRSPMPLSPFDPGETLLGEYKQSGIDLIVMLVSDEEAQQRTGLDLRKRYAEEGFEVLQCPIPDFGVPSEMDGLLSALEETLRQARAGKNLVVHCFAGLGRTGMFAALLAKEALGFSGTQAIAWVREHIPGAIETQQQVRLVKSLDKK